MKSALLVIDFQEAVFLNPPAFKADVVLKRIQKLIAQARAAGMPVIYVQHEEAGTAWEAGRDTWSFPQEIAPQTEDYISAKHSCDAFSHSGLAQHLADQGIGKVFVCGYPSGRLVAVVG